MSVGHNISENSEVNNLSHDKTQKIKSEYQNFLFLKYKIKSILFTYLIK